MPRTRSKNLALFDKGSGFEQSQLIEPLCGKEVSVVAAPSLAIYVHSPRIRP